MDEPSQTLPTPDIHTYHCICTALILASTSLFGSLPTRAPPAQDAALILDVRSRAGKESRLQNIVRDHKPIIVRREDGFEKRVLLRCARCHLVIGYYLDSQQLADAGATAEDIVYLLPGGLQSTEDMTKKTALEVPVWAKETA